MSDEQIKAMALRSIARKAAESFTATVADELMYREMLEHNTEKLLPYLQRARDMGLEEAARCASDAAECSCPIVYPKPDKPGAAQYHADCCESAICEEIAMQVRSLHSPTDTPPDKEVGDG